MPEIIPTVVASVSDKAKQASRVIRTLHQAIITAVVAALPLVAVFDLPADKVAASLAFVSAILTGVAKVYNVLFPAEDPLDETPDFPDYGHGRRVLHADPLPEPAVPAEHDLQNPFDI
jgi:hypothetical protein